MNKDEVMVVSASGSLDKIGLSGWTVLSFGKVSASGGEGTSEYSVELSSQETIVGSFSIRGVFFVMTPSKGTERAVKILLLEKPSFSFYLIGCWRYSLV